MGRFLGKKNALEHFENSRFCQNPGFDSKPGFEAAFAILTKFPPPIAPKFGWHMSWVRIGTFWGVLGPLRLINFFPHYYIVVGGSCSNVWKIPQNIKVILITLKGGSVGVNDYFLFFYFCLFLISLNSFLDTKIFSCK